MLLATPWAVILFFKAQLQELDKIYSLNSAPLFPQGLTALSVLGYTDKEKYLPCSSLHQGSSRGVTVPMTHLLYGAPGHSHSPALHTMTPGDQSAGGRDTCWLVQSYGTQIRNTYVVPCSTKVPPEGWLFPWCLFSIELQAMVTLLHCTQWHQGTKTLRGEEIDGASWSGSNAFSSPSRSNKYLTPVVS